MCKRGEKGGTYVKQTENCAPVWQTGLDNPSFAGYAKLCGALGICAKTPEEVSKALDEMLTFDGPALLEVMTDPDIS